MLSPGDSLRRSVRNAAAQRHRVLTHLFLEWDLKIEGPEDGQSPSKRPPPTSKADGYAKQAYFEIYYLTLKDGDALSLAIKAFDHAAKQVQSRWVHESNADSDLLPRSESCLNPRKTIAQQEELFQCLLSFIDPAYKNVKEHQAKKGRTMNDRTLLSRVSNPVFTPASASYANDLDDTPIPFSLGSQGTSKDKNKRRSDNNFDVNDDSKRARCPPDDSPTKIIIDAVDSVPVITRPKPPNLQSSFPQRPPLENPYPLPPVGKFKVPPIPASLPSDRVTGRPALEMPHSANTSFSSSTNISFVFGDNISFTSKANASVTTPFSSFFSRESSEESNDSYCTTHTSLLDVSFERRIDLEPRSPMEVDDRDETEYGSALDVVELENDIRFSPEDHFHERLQNVFPHLPASLKNAPLSIRYEVTRVCLYAKVSLNDIDFPDADWSELHDYERLWDYLRNHSELKGREFPEKSDRVAWAASLRSFDHGFYGVLLSAKIKFSKLQEDPLFCLQLQPLKIEKSHRLGRRFGNDRFLEISLPDLYGTNIPKLLKIADESNRGDACRKVIVEWMTRSLHDFLGITWGAFFLKDARPRKKKLQLSNEEKENVISNYVYFFATDGLDFQENGRLPPKGEAPATRTKMTVNALINWLIPLQQNRQEKLPKLFSRIGLGLSKTWKTVELKLCQLRYMPENLLSTNGKEVMNDGCGRISKKMAAAVANCLGLTYIPCGFQARIGGAKGFWIIDVNDLTDQIWIELYPSQVKWNRDILYATHVEADHRTFEVVGWVKPLTSASLNLQFLPILEDRGRTRSAMRDAISRLLVEGLSFEIEKQRAAMDSPQLFRQWVRENSGLEERLKYGRVQYKTGLPNSLEEQINMLLDGGFDPKYLQFLKDLAWKAFRIKCDLLKRKMKIAVGRSTYAYMAVDFEGVLEPDQVHIGFSTHFRDDQSGFDEVVLDGMDILVARSPAHFISDIQRVKAVWKRELKSLKDVIVFSSRGTYPLAKKLSGGDYDGDTAWICFEPTIVDIFENADVPISQNLVQLGYIREDQSRYSDLMAKQADLIPEFLQYSFEFNLRQSLLGVCTTFKEKYCYTVDTVSNDEAVFLSTLLSDLVDQYKQGYIFTADSWENIKKTVIKIMVKKPNYMLENFEGNGKPQHIIDHLKFIVAERTVEDTLGKFHQSLEAAQCWDRDLVKFSDWAQKCAKVSDEWKNLLDQLREEIVALNGNWKRRFSRQKSPESLANFVPIASDFYDEWQAIQPKVNNPLSQALAPSCLPDQDYSSWSLLKASLGFSLSAYKNKSYVGSFIWWMAGKQLAYLKAQFNNGITAVTPDMYAMLKPDSTFVKLMHSEEHEPKFWEAKAESVMLDDEEEMED